MNGLDLFSGIGGISEALSPWVKTIAYCEVEPKSRAILLSRMYRGEVDPAPIWDDVFTLSGRHIDVPIDIISGGFPCTDISLAGLRKGIRSDRSGLFWEVVRLTKEKRPSFVFLENVWPGVRKFVPTIRYQFESLGYTVRDGFIAARDVGAPHRRRRWFMLAYSNENKRRLYESKKRKQNTNAIPPVEIRHDPNKAEIWQQPGRGEWQDRQGEVQSLESLAHGENADPNETGLQGSGLPIRTKTKESELADLLDCNDWDGLAAFFCRIDNGLPLRNYRIGALGDSVVPQQARRAFEILMGIKEQPDEK